MSFFTKDAVTRPVGLLLITLGAALIAFAPLMRFWVASAIMRTPLSHYEVTTATATGATFANPENGEKFSDQNVIQTTTTRVDVAASKPETVVYDRFRQLAKGDAAADHGSSDVLEDSMERLAADRVSGELSPCCGAGLDGVSVGHIGVSYRFPRNVERKTYDYFDLPTKSSAPMKFVKAMRITGVSALQGIPVYQFRQQIPVATTGTVDVPGKWVESPEERVTLEKRYKVTRDVFVEPRTGIIVRMVEDRSTTARVPGSDTDAAVLFQGTLIWSAESIDRAAGQVKEELATLNTYANVYPLGLLTLGVLVLGVGMVLFWRVDNNIPLFGKTQQPEPAWV